MEVLNSDRRNFYDLFIVPDERDVITRYLHKIKRELETITPRQKLKIGTILDYSKGKQSIRCRKVVFLLSQYTGSLKTMVPIWLDALGIDATERDRYLIINHDAAMGDNGSDDGIRQEAGNVIHVANLDRGHLWWPKLLLFCFRRKKIKSGKAVGDTSCFLRNSEISGEYSRQLLADIRDGLNLMDIAVSDTVFGATCCALVTDGGRMRWWSTADVDVLDAIQTAKASGCRVHTISTNSTPILPELRRVTNVPHKQNEMLRFWLWLLTDLGVIDITVEKSCDISIKTTTRPPAGLKFKVYKSLVWLRWKKQRTVTKMTSEPPARFVVIEKKMGAGPWTVVDRVKEVKESHRTSDGDLRLVKNYKLRVKIESELEESRYVNLSRARVFCSRLHYSLSRTVHWMSRSRCLCIFLACILCPPFLLYPLTPLAWVAYRKYKKTGEKRYVYITAVIWAFAVYAAMIGFLCYIFADQLVIICTVGIFAAMCSVLLGVYSTRNVELQ